MDTETGPLTTPPVDPAAVCVHSWYAAIEFGDEGKIVHSLKCRKCSTREYVVEVPQWSAK